MGFAIGTDEYGKAGGVFARPALSSATPPTPIVFFVASTLVRLKDFLALKCILITTVLCNTNE